MKNITKLDLLTVVGASLSIVAFAQLSPPPVLPPPFGPPALVLPAPPAPPQFGDPLPGLTADQLAAFAAGSDEFLDEETPERGLGPIFNNVSCVVCHFAPAVGGSSAILETRFGRVEYGQFDPLTELGGSLLQQSAIDPRCQEIVPPEANIVAQRQTTPLFGLGLIEAISDSTILLNAAIPRPDGITGRPSMVQDVVSGQSRVGRFGWKAQQATLLAFSGDAYVNEMGITSRLFPQENAPNGNTDLLALFDNVADPEDVEDPETGKANIDNFTDFMRFLAPPPPVPLTLSGQSGQILFTGIGCAACHTPVMQTGANSVAALDRQPVRLYSDLLLHNIDRKSVV